MITVMGANGNTGRKIAQRLLASGQQIRVIGRSESKLAELGQQGAEIAVGDARDRAFLARAFRGADAVYTLVAADATAPDLRLEQDRLGEAIVAALRETKVPHVVALSSLGADLSHGNGPIAGLHVQEQRLRQLTGTAVLALRPAWFFENFLTWLPLIRQAGIAGDSLAPDHAQPMVGTEDIAAVAADALIARNWRGFTVRELLGPRDVSANEVTRLLREKLGHPDLAYTQFSDADTEAALQQAGLSPSFATAYTEMTRAINAGKLQPVAGRTAANTTPTDFASYAAELAALHAAS